MNSHNAQSITQAPGRGRHLKLAGPKKKYKSTPEKTTVMLPCAKLHFRPTRTTTVVSSVSPYEFCPGMFCAATAADGNSPVVGSSPGQRLKDSVNVHSAVYRWCTKDLAAGVNYRICLVQLTEALEAGDPSLLYVKGADAYDLVYHPGGEYNSNVGSSVAISGVVDDARSRLYWGDFFNDYCVASFFHPQSSQWQAQPAQSLESKRRKLNFKVLYDKLICSNDGQHSGEFTFKDYRLTFHSTIANTPSRSVPFNEGRMMLFLVRDPVADASFDAEGYMSITGRMVYSDE